MKKIKFEFELKEFGDNKLNDFVSSIKNEVEEKRERINVILANNEIIKGNLNGFGLKIMNEFNEALKDLNLKFNHRTILTTTGNGLTNIYKLGEGDQGITLYVYTPKKYNSKLKVDECIFEPKIKVKVLTASHVLREYDFVSVEDTLTQDRELIKRLYEGDGKVLYSH